MALWDDLVASALGNKWLVAAVLFFFWQFYQSRLPFPATGGNVRSIKSMEDWQEFLKSSPVAFVDFFATWCPPCKRAAPVIGQLSLKYPGCAFAKVDVDKVRAVAQQQGISSMPTFKMFKNGVKTDEFSGFSEEKMKDMLVRAGCKEATAGSKQS